MPGAHLNLRLGPSTYEVNVAVTGGMLVEVDGTTGKIKPATAGSLKVLGVAVSDANPAGSDPSNPQNFAWPRPDVAVYYGPADVDVTYAASAAFGDLLIAAANGQVTPAPAVTTPTATDVTNTRAIVGMCTDPAGVTSASVGRMRMRI